MLANWIKYIGILFVLLLTFIAKGQIQVKEPVRDLGDIFEKSGPVTIQFELENPYRNDTIIIADIITSCGCTAALAEDTVIYPGSSLSLDVVYDPTNRPGLFVKSIELTTRSGVADQHKFYLKILGNVVQESFTGREVSGELKDYQVAPIYFYPITWYDTAYFSLSYLETFVNDLTYEIDYHQFTTIGMDVVVTDLSEVLELEPQLDHLKEKIQQAFYRRGYAPTTVFFDEPFVKISDSLPNWATGSICLYSSNFDAPHLLESEIEVIATENVKQEKMLLSMERFALPEVEEVLDAVNFETIETKLFLNGGLTLKGQIHMPWKKSEKLRKKTAKKVRKAIQKAIKSRTGANSKEVSITIDPTFIHRDNKYKFLLWDEADRETTEHLKYVVKPEEITPPLLPTYRTYYELGKALSINERKFVHFWENLILNAKAGHPVELLINVGYFQQDENIKHKWQAAAQQVSDYLSGRFKEETGFDLNIITKLNRRGPRYNDLKDLKLDFKRFNYINLIPIVHNRKDIRVAAPSPYQVNFDLYFNGIDKGAFGLHRFVKEIAKMVNKYGYVELVMESSASKIELDEHLSNKTVAYQRLLESQKRLLEVMVQHLIDPNRILFSDEVVIIQGPEYDGSLPVLSYRDYHYLKIIPEKYLKR